MRVRFIVLAFFMLSRTLAFAQNAGDTIHQNDSTQIYFFDLFNEKRAMNWGTIPKNFPFINYRVYLKNNSLDTLRIGSVTTGDGRVTYHLDSKTRIIYPDEYIVLKPLHNGTQMRDRHGGFGRSIHITLQANDTIYYVSHRYLGSFSKDTILPKFTRKEPDEILSPKRKPVELDTDRKMIAETDRKLDSLGMKRTNFIYVIYNDSIFSTPHHVYSRTKWRSSPMPLEMAEIPHYLFNLYSNETMIRIELGGFNDERIHLKLEPNKGQYICANYNGKTRYFAARKACENYIRRLKVTH